MPTTPGKRKQDLGNQMLGLLLALCLFVLFIVWMVDVPAILRYGATGIIAGLLAVRALYAAGQRRKIERIRTQQFRAHRSKGQD